MQLIVSNLSFAKLMFSLNESHRCYLYPEACDMRKGFDTLSGVVLSRMHRNPVSGEGFIFVNRKRTSIKLLHWERGGLVIYHKRLESGCFSLPVSDEKNQSYPLRWADSVLMVEGISTEKSGTKDVLSSDYIRMDETTIPVVDQDKPLLIPTISTPVWRGMSSMAGTKSTTTGPKMESGL